MDIRRLTSPEGVPNELAIRSVSLTFDSRKQTNHNAGQLYEIIKAHHPTPACSPVYGTEINFDSRQNTRIQMADLLARETMKHFDNIIGPVKRPARKSLLAMTDARPERFWFTYLTREWAEDKKRKEAESEAALGMSKEALRLWLQERGLADNWSNRLRWLREQGE